MRRPPPDEAGSAPFMPRWALYLALPGAIGPLLIFAFILLTERAHTPSSCPFAEVGRRTLAEGIEVVEDGRRCLDGVEERRFRVLRGAEEHLLGNRRFEPSAFEAAHYGWDAGIVDGGEVTLRVRNDGHPPAVFREGTEEERRTGIPRKPAQGPRGP